MYIFNFLSIILLDILWQIVYVEYPLKFIGHIVFRASFFVVFLGIYRGFSNCFKNEIIELTTNEIIYNNPWDLVEERITRVEMQVINISCSMNLLVVALASKIRPLREDGGCNSKVR